MGRMRWVKLWTQETLYGTTNRELTLEERAIWFEMLALAGDSPTPGIICVSPNVSFTNAQLAQILGAPEDLVSLTLVKLSSPEIDKISLNGTGLITIINFQRYQESFDKTEYQRIYMKAYRERKSNESETNESETNQQKGREGRGGEEEGKRKDNIKEPPIVPLKRGPHPKRQRNKKLSSEERRQSLIRTEIKHPGLVQGLSEDILAEAARIRAEQNESSS